MLYLWLKYIHILSSTILFGTGLGTATVMVYGHYQKNILVKASINHYVVLMDWVFTGTSGLIQLIRGLGLIYLGGYSLAALWLVGGLIGYFLVALCWFTVVYLQIKIRDLTLLAAQTNAPLPALYEIYFKKWMVLGWTAFFLMLTIFYLMVMKPNG